MQMQFLSPFGPPRAITIDDLPSDAIFWSINSLVHSRWDTAAISLQGSSIDQNYRELRVYDLHTDTVIESRSLEDNEILLPSYNRQGHYYIGAVTDNIFTVSTFSMQPGQDPAELVTSTEITLPEDINPANITHVVSYIPQANDQPGLIIANIEGQSEPVALAFDSNGQGSILSLPEGDWTRAEAITTADGTIFLNLGDGTGATSGFILASTDEELQWVEVDGEAFDFLRYQLYSPESVIRDGEHAFDLTQQWSGELDILSTQALPSGGVLARVSQWDDENTIGFERWVVFKDGNIDADKNFDFGAGPAMRTITGSDINFAYFQQIQIDPEGDGDLVQNQDPAITIHRVALSDIADAIISANETVANEDNAIAVFSAAAITGGELDAGYILSVNTYQETSAGAIVAAETFDLNGEGPGAVHIAFSSEPGQGIVTQQWSAEGEYVEAMRTLPNGQFAIAIDSEEGRSFHLIDPATGQVSDTDATVYAIARGDINVAEGLNLVIGSLQADNLEGTSGADYIVASEGDDTINAGDGDDTIRYTAGADSINGGQGTDTLVIDDQASNYELVRSANVWTATHLQDQTSITFSHIERIQWQGELQELTNKTVANDFDGDGRSDILWKNAATGSMWSWNGGSGQEKTWMGSMADSRWQLIATGDFAGDRSADMVWRHTDNGSLWVWNDGSGSDKYRIGGMADKNWQLVGVGDFTGDGKADMLWQNTATGSLWRWNDGSGTNKTWLGSQGGDWQIAGVADFNGDGTDDILWRNMANGSLWTWNSGDAQDKTRLGAFNDSKWQIVGVGDFYGDGKADIVWQSVDAGSVWIWNDGNGADKERVGALPVAQWGVSAVGDYDGDGKADLLWHNSQTGEARMWMQGQSSESETAGRLGDLNWHMAEQAKAGGTMQGGAGNNVLYGTTQADHLMGGAGDDVLTGGAGADHFVFNSLVGIDIIKDFSAGSDKLVFDSSVFTGLTTENAAERISVNAQGQLMYDADGAGEGEALQIATLQNNGSLVTVLNTTDYLVI